jgi:hypothetical protein
LGTADVGQQRIAFASAESSPRQFQIVLSAADLQAGEMKAHATVSGSEILLGVLAIRLAALVLTGSILLLLQQPADNEPANAPSPAANSATQTAAKIERLAFEDMRLHDQVILSPNGSHPSRLGK